MRRLVGLLLVALWAWGGAQETHAQAIPKQEINWTLRSVGGGAGCPGGGGGPWNGTHQEVAESIAMHCSPGFYCGANILTYNPGTHDLTFAPTRCSNGSGDGFMVAQPESIGCPPGYIEDPENSAQCIPEAPPCPAEGTPHPQQGMTVTGGGTLPTVLCDAGCAYSKGSGVDVQLAGSWGSTWGVSLGRECQAGDVPGTTSSCQVGTCPGTFNGQQICLPCASHPDAQQVSQTTTASSSSTQKDGSGSTTGSSTTDTTTVTTCTGAGSCTTTVTTTVTQYDASGNPIGTTTTDTKQEQSDDFCKKNPSLSICQVSQWGGSCSSGFACEGDAVQCAQARAAYELACELTKEDAITQLGRDVVAGNDPASGVPDPNNPEVVDVASASGGIDQTAWIGSVCPADRTFAFGDYTITIPFASAPMVCEALQLLGNLLVMFALIGAFFIVGIF